MFASFGYIIDGFGKFIGYSTQITMITFIGEVLFAFWLLFKGNKISSNQPSMWLKKITASHEVSFNLIAL